MSELESTLTSKPGICLDKVLIPIPKDIPVCYYCGSKDTYDIITNDKGMYLRIYSRRYGEIGFYYCKRCHKRFMWIDKVIGNIIYTVFSVYRRFNRKRIN